MKDWIIQAIATYGYLGIFLLIALENLFPPIPSEVILTFGGFMTSMTSMNLFGAATAATAGSMAGALALYWLSRSLGQKRITHLLSRHRRWLRISPKSFGRAVDWFERYQNKTVFFCRMVPLLRSLISLPAGIAAMPLGRFCVLTAGGSLLWNTGLIYAGALLGENWDSILGYLSLYSTAVVLLLATLLVLGTAWLLVRRTIFQKQI